MPEEEIIQVYKPSINFSTKAYIKNMDEYKKMYKESIKGPDKFWGKLAAEQVSWYKKWNKVQEYDFKKGNIKWFDDAKLNVSYNCLDRHVENGHGNDIAIIWEGNEPNLEKKFTYKQLLDEVQKFANVLESQGIKKGDRVCIYLQMIPELAISMLACTRIGAIHSIVFGGFSAESLRDRINDSSCKILITQDHGLRGGKPLPMKQVADKALPGCPSIESVIVVKRIGEKVDWSNKDYWWHEEMKKVEPICPPVKMDSEDPLFILYTSGSTGKPKGVLHTTGGYLVFSSVTHKYIFDYHQGDIYWCTADIGWVTGHSYIVYGPLCNKAITIIFE